MNGQLVNHLQLHGERGATSIDSAAIFMASTLGLHFEWYRKQKLLRHFTALFVSLPPPSSYTIQLQFNLMCL